MNFPSGMTIRLVVTTAALLVVAGCSGDSGETTTTGIAEATTAAPTTTNGSAPGTTIADPPDTTAVPTVLTLEDVFVAIATQPTEPGPRPLLAWDPVPGADIYEVVVLGANGLPYWAWSGAKTAINVGGSDEPLALGAWVHEAMTWTVSAQTADGEVLGLSAAADLQP